MLILKWPQGEKIRVRSQVSFNDFTMSVKKDRDWFKATGSLTINEDLALDLKQLMTLLETSPVRGRFVALDDGTFLALTRSLKARLEELRAYATVHGKGVRFNPLAVPAIEELTDQIGSLKSDNAWKTHCKKLKEIIQPEVPRTLRAKLRDYQITGFKWLAQLAHWQMGACLADDMGLGKTVQALSAILLHADQGPTLVVAPVSVMGNDYVIHMDPWWNPAVEDQASDRAHRIGQTRPVTVYRLVVKDSIEERIVNLHKEKRELAESLLAGSEAAGKVSASELLALLKGTA